MDQTELEFLNDMNALLSDTLETKGADPWQALRALANEVRSRIDELAQRRHCSSRLSGARHTLSCSWKGACSSIDRTALRPALTRAHRHAWLLTASRIRACCNVAAWLGNMSRWRRQIAPSNP